MASHYPSTLAARPVNPWFKIAAAVIAVLCLSAPSAVGVYRALEPTRGAIASGLAAGGFELAYLSLSLLTLRPELRRHARAVALGAVSVAVSLNSLADYAHRVPDGLASAALAAARFDWLALVLSVGESAPLAVLAYALASLLHRLAEQPEDVPAADTGQEGHAPAYRGPVLVAQPSASWARVSREGGEVCYPAPVEVRAAVSGSNVVNPPAEGQIAEKAGFIGSQPEKTLVCRHCGAGGFTFSELGQHSRSCPARQRKAA